MDFEQEMDTKYCSNCRRDIATNIYEMHEAHCKRNIVLCRVCSEPVPKVQLEEHYNDNHIEVPCDLCGRKYPKDQIDTHKEEDCLERKISCEYCELEVKAIDYQEHVAACGSRTDVCDKCLQRVMLRDMETHHKRECGKPRPPAIEPRPQTNPYRFYPPLGVVRPSGAMAMGGAVGSIGGMLPIATDSRDLLSEQLEFEENYGMKGQSTMMLYNLSIKKSKEDEEKLKQIESDELLAQKLYHELQRSTSPVYHIPSPHGSPLPVHDVPQRKSPSPVYNIPERRSPSPPEHHVPTRQVPVIPLEAIFDISPPMHSTIEELNDNARKLQEKEDQNTQEIFRASPTRSPSHSPTHVAAGASPTVTKEEDEKVPCDICNEFVSFYLYQYHMRENHPNFANFIDAQNKHYYGNDYHGNSPPTNTVDPPYSREPPYSRPNEVKLQEEEDQNTQEIFRPSRTPPPSPTRSPSHSPTHVAAGASPTVTKEENEKVPCDICNELVSFYLYQYHMRENHPNFADVIDAHNKRYGGNGYHGNNSPPTNTALPYTVDPPYSREPPYSRVNEVPPYTPYGVNATAAELDIEDDDKQKKCQYCGFSYSASAIEYHETICDENPEKDLKNVRGRSSSYKPVASASPEPEITDGLPCQFCNKLISFDIFDRHQRNCPDRFLPRNLEIDGLYGIHGNSRDTPSTFTEAKSSYESCPYCEESILTSRMFTHKLSCLKKIEEPAVKQERTYKSYTSDISNTSTTKPAIKPRTKINSSNTARNKTDILPNKPGRDLTEYRVRLENEQRNKHSLSYNSSREQQFGLTIERSNDEVEDMEVDIPYESNGRGKGRGSSFERGSSNGRGSNYGRGGSNGRGSNYGRGSNIGNSYGRGSSNGRGSNYGRGGSNGRGSNYGKGSNIGNGYGRGSNIGNSYGRGSSATRGNTGRTNGRGHTNY